MQIMDAIIVIHNEDLRIKPAEKIRTIFNQQNFDHRLEKIYETEKMFSRSDKNQNTSKKTVLESQSIEENTEIGEEFKLFFIFHHKFSGDSNLLYSKLKLTYCSEYNESKKHFTKKINKDYFKQLQQMWKKLFSEIWFNKSFENLWIIFREI